MHSSNTFISQPEGYVEPNTDGGFDYVYQYKDHLGNVRLSYSDSEASVIIEEDFTNTTYDWSSASEVLLSENDNNLQVSIKNKWSSTSKYVTFTPGIPVHIAFDFETIDMVNPIFYVREQIDGVWEAYSDRDYRVLNHDGRYELTLNPTGNLLRLYFEKGNASDNGTFTGFKVDNLVVTQYILEIVEENNYYPFGLKHKGYNNVVSANANSVASKFKYNGVELEESLGLNLYETNLRLYDPAIGRWNAIDIVDHFEYSPYQAFDNNPIFFADPSGADSIYNFETGQYVINGQEVSFDEAVAYAENGGNADGSNNNNCCNDPIQFFNWLGSLLGLNNYNIGDDIESKINGTKNPANNTLAPVDLGVKKWIANNKDDLLSLAQIMQDVGDGGAVVGYALTVSVIGAEVGIPLAASGNIVSTMGSGLEITVHLTQRDLENATNEAGWVVAGKLFDAGLKKIPGGSQLANEIIQQNGAVKMILTERIVESKK